MPDHHSGYIINICCQPWSFRLVWCLDHTFAQKSLVLLQLSQ